VVPVVLEALVTVLPVYFPAVVVVVLIMEMAGENSPGILAAVVAVHTARNRLKLVRYTHIQT
jgi:hypothetical protein